MQKVFKLCLVMVAVFALLSLSVFSVTAAGGLVKWNTTYVSLDVLQIYNSSRWVSPDSFSFTTEVNTERGFVYARSTNGISKWRARFYPTSSFPSYVVNERFLQLDVSLNYWNMISSNAYEQTITGALYMTAPDSKIYEFPITDQTAIMNGTTIESYLLTIGGVADVGIGFDLKDCVFEFNFSGATSNQSIELYFNNFDFAYRSKYTDDTVQIVESVEKGFADLENKIEQSTQDIINNNNANTDKITNNQDANTDKIIGNQDANTDKITGSIEDSTDEITNGWETDDDTADKADGAVNGLGDAESDALGGKTDEQIQGEIDNALGGYDFPEQTPDNIIKVGMTFDDLLDCFGAQYESLLILALTLGLGAYLVGRQFKTKE